MPIHARFSRAVLSAVLCTCHAFATPEAPANGFANAGSFPSLRLSSGVLDFPPANSQQEAVPGPWVAVVTEAAIGTARDLLTVALADCGTVEGFLPPAAFLLHIQTVSHTGSGDRAGGNSVATTARACLSSLAPLQDPKNSVITAIAPLSPRLRTNLPVATMMDTLQQQLQPTEPDKTYIPYPAAGADDGYSTIPVRVLSVSLAARGGSIAALRLHVASLAYTCPSCTLVASAAPSPAGSMSARLAASGAPTIVHISAIGRACAAGCALRAPVSCGCAVSPAYVAALVAHPDVLWVSAASQPRTHNAFNRLITTTTDLVGSTDIAREWGSCGDGGDCTLMAFAPFTALSSLFPALAGGSNGSISTSSAYTDRGKSRYTATGECSATCAAPACGLGYSTCADLVSPISLNGLDGAEQLVHVTDTGLDYANPLFFDPWVSVLPSKAFDPIPLSTHRKVAAYWSFMDAYDDVSGHGTHVAGTLAGSPSQNVGGDDFALLRLLQGSAPASRLIFTDTFCNDLAGCAPPAGIVSPSCPDNFCSPGAMAFPADMSYLFGPAYESGARISSNSWGEGKGTSQYNAESAVLDAIVSHVAPDLLIVFSASNDGQDSNGNPALATIEYQAAAKNVLAVGATKDGLQAHLAKILGLKTADVAFLSSMYGAGNIKSCDSIMLQSKDGCLPISDASCMEMASENFDLAFCCGCSPADVLYGAYDNDFANFGIFLLRYLSQYSPRARASFSSMGPTLDGRIKPDVAAPGFDTISARSSGFSAELQPYNSFICPIGVNSFDVGPVGQTSTPLIGGGPTNYLELSMLIVNEPVLIVSVTLSLVALPTGGRLYMQFSDASLTPLSLLSWVDLPSAATSAKFPFNFTLAPGGTYVLLLFADTGVSLTVLVDDSGTPLYPCFGSVSNTLGVTISFSRGSGGAYSTSKSGTSMATPHAAGLATLVRQYFTLGFYPSGAAVPGDSLSPSAALIKATLINSASALNDAALGALLARVLPAINDSVPSLPQQRAEAGFGIVNLVRGLSFTTLGSASRGDGGLPSLLLPGLTASESAPIASMPAPPPNSVHFGVDPSVAAGEEAIYCIDVSAPASGAPSWLSLTLVWTDPPGNPAAAYALVNNLDLEVTPPGGSAASTLWGNNDPALSPQQPDDRNNVEKLYLPSPLATLDREAGNRMAPPYNVLVRGARVPFGPQAYSLVITGPGVTSGPPGTCGGDPQNPSPAAAVDPKVVGLAAATASLGAAVVLVVAWNFSAVRTAASSLSSIIGNSFRVSGSVSSGSTASLLKGTIISEYECSPIHAVPADTPSA